MVQKKLRAEYEKGLSRGGTALDVCIPLYGSEAETKLKLETRHGQQFDVMIDRPVRGHS